MNQNSVLIRRRKKIIVPPGAGSLPVEMVATINKNLEGLGYTFSASVLEALANLDEQQAAEFYKETVAVLQELKGVKRYRPMYPNFPRQVMEASTAELYMNAMIHYGTVALYDALGDKRRRLVWLPEFRKNKRDPLPDKVNLTVIERGTEDDLRQMFARMISSKSALSKTDREDLAWFAANYVLQLPEVIPNKEVLAFVGGLQPHNPELRKHIKTATDVLRLAVAMSGGDVSLAENTKFRNFSRAERKTLLSLLENCGSVTEDMMRRRGHWLRLGEKLHPGEYAKRYPRTAQSFDIVRNELPFETFNSRVEAAIRSRKLVEAIDLLRDRPGEFARRLDHLVRLDPGDEIVVSHFADGASRISTPVLLQVSAHFKNRMLPQDLRIFFPKGELAKVTAINYNLPPISPQTCEQLVRISEELLIERFAKLPPLGKVYVDPELDAYLVPFSQRSASKSLRTLVRGSRIQLPTNGNTIRFFLWWREGDVDGKPTGRVDLDLSAVMLDSEWLYKEHVSYTNLKSNVYRSYHSGDITSAPHGACEFIDIDMPSVVRYGGRYVVMAVKAYTGQHFLHLPECKAGWMMREKPDSGEVFEPSTVEDRIDIASDSRICIPVILDLHEGVAVWADLALKKHPRYVNNVEGNLPQMALLGKSITEVIKPDLFSLFTLHARARGTLVSSETDADTVFSLTKGITPYDLERIVSEFL